jgi:hypothetical protein
MTSKLKKDFVKKLNKIKSGEVLILIKTKSTKLLNFARHTIKLIIINILKRSVNLSYRQIISYI